MKDVSPPDFGTEDTQPMSLSRLPGTSPGSPPLRQDFTAPPNRQDTQPITATRKGSLPEGTRGYWTLALDRSKLEIAQGVDDALDIGGKNNLLPVGKLVDLQVFITKLREVAAERLKRRKPGKFYPSARSWWFWHMLKDHATAKDSEKQDTLLGASGYWFHHAEFEHEAPIETTEQFSAAATSVIRGLVDYRLDALRKLRNLHDHFSMEVFKKSKVHNGIFDDRLHRGEGIASTSDWMEYAARNGYKDIGLCHPVDAKHVISRTPQEMNTIVLRFPKGDRRGERTLWLSLSGNTIQPEMLQKQIQLFLESGYLEFGDRVEHPLFEVSVSDASEDSADLLNLEYTARVSPLAKVVLNQNRAQHVAGIDCVYSHLTANEDQGHDITQSVLHRMGQTSEIPDAPMYSQTISRRYLPHGATRTYRNENGQHVPTGLKDVEVMATYQWSLEELGLVRTAQHSSKQHLTLSELIGLAQAELTNGSGYFCVAPEGHELQIGLFPFGNTERYNVLFDTWTAIIQEYMHHDDMTPELLRRTLAKERSMHPGVTVIFQEFQKFLAPLTKYVNEEVRRGKLGRGVVSILDTYIPGLAQAMFKHIARSASIIIASGNWQISSTNHGKSNPIQFITALAKDVATGIGVSSGKDVNGGAWRNLTMRWRAGDADIERFMQDISSTQNVEKHIEHAARMNVERSTALLRRNLALLSLLITVSGNPNEVLHEDAPLHPVFTFFYQAWKRSEQEHPINPKYFGT